MQPLKCNSIWGAEIIVQIKVGSHLYGTATTYSDIDIKGVYIPHTREILLQRAKPTISITRDKAHGEKNTREDTDYELYSLSKFLALLSEGQSIALEMLFAPDNQFISTPHPLWLEIKKLAPKIFSKQAASFVRYCRKQANNYGNKGARIAAVRAALDYMIKAEEQYGSSAKLNIIEKLLQELTINNEFLVIKEDLKLNGTKTRYLEICGKKADLNASIKLARLIAKKLIDEYGERALQAERNAGVDWKALSHAIRVGREAIEFITTHNLTFPRPEAKYLIDIKNGKISFQQVSNEIEEIIGELDLALENTTLPESFDQQLIDNFVEKVYKKQIIDGEKL